MTALDALTKKSRLEQAVSRRLRLLRGRAERPYLLVKKDLLDISKKFFFRLGLILPKRWYRNFILFGLAGFFMLAVMMGLRVINTGVTVSKEILGTATTGMEFLQAGKLDLALQNFQAAASDLQNSANDFQGLLNFLPGGIDAGQIRQASSDIVAALSFAQQGLQAFKDLRLSWNAATNSSDQGFYQKLLESRSDLVKSQERLESALAVLDVLPFQYLPEGSTKEKIMAGQSRLSAADAALKDAISLQGFILSLLSGPPKTYLVIFENNAELRPTGGFIGTFGRLQFADGRFNLSDIQTIYNLDGQLKGRPGQVAAPGPLQRVVTTFWGMRDSNWFVDYPTTARKVLDFYQKESGQSADGVVAMTPDIFAKLLAIVGPVPMPKYGVTLDANNFREVVQFKTSVDYDKIANEPKQFLADFTPAFMAKLQNLSEGQWLQVLGTFSEMVAQKQLLMFSTDQGLENQIKGYHADGGIWPTGGDYLAIYNANLGGGKTDQEIVQKVDKSVSLISDGSAIVKLKITRESQAFDEKFFPKNLDFMRILVPPQARLLSASGFDDAPLLPSTARGAATDPDLAKWDAGFRRDDQNKIYIGAEAGYTVFANWQELLPGQSKTVQLTFEIPFPKSQIFTEYIQKQPGSLPFDLNLTIKSFKGQIVHVYPENFAPTGSELQITQPVKGDQFYGVITQ